MHRLQKLRYRGQWGRLNKAKIMRLVAITAFLGAIAGCILLLVLFTWYAKDLPRPDKIVRREGFASKIYDRTGDVLYDVYNDERRIPVKPEDIPDLLKKAVVAIEDKHFYQHQGFDITGWIRSLATIVFQRRLQGGSTITQQLVKNVLLTQERTLPRKIKEFILAIQIERKYSKDEIMQMYLNESPYGGTAWGVETASELYFSKKTKDLNLLESAFLAGLPQRPSYYSPFYGTEDAFQSRTKDVLRRMREENYITRTEEDEALVGLEKMQFASPSGSFKAPHFVMYVRQLLEDKYGSQALEIGGLKVHTTLDLDLQEKAEKVVAEEIAKVEKYDITNGAAVILDPQTGEIWAMVGSKDYFAENYDGKYNVVTALRQPGSAIKPATYAAAFIKGFTPATMLVDAETDFPGGAGQKPYHPKNYTLQDYGPTQLRYCLGNSLNICSVKLLARTGVDSMLATAYEMGFKTLEPTKENISRFGLAITLGGGEVRPIDMAASYSVFANGGYKVEPIAILKVEDINGKVLDEVKPNKGSRVMDEGITYLVNSILSDNNARLLTFSANSQLNITGAEVAVKTGTTDDKRDNWTVGWTPHFLVNVWVGNNDNSPMKQVASGITGASPIWRRLVLHLLTKNPGSTFTKPENISEIEVDTVSGYRSHHGFAARKEYFVKGTEPDENDPVHTMLKLCRGQEKLAVDILVAKGDYDEKEYIVLKENDPVSSDGQNRWQEGINAWVAKQGDPKYHAPTEYCSTSEERLISFREPKNETTYGNELSVDIDAYAVRGVQKIELFVNNTLKETVYNKPYAFKITLTDGVYTLKAVLTDNDLKNAETSVKIGVNKPWDWGPSPTPTITPIPPSLTPTVVPTATPTPVPTSAP